MLPFSKRKNTGDEIELDDDDLVVLVESSSPSSSPLLTRGVDEAPPTARRRRVTASVSRRIIDESVVDGVAGECRSAIAAAARIRHSSSHVRAAFTPSRLPSVSPPPFVRTNTTTSLVPFSVPSSSPSTHDSAPPPAFVRRSNPMIAVARATRSDAPMSVSSRTDEPTVIVVRERPQTARVIGAAAIGAVFAVLASYLAMSNDGSPTSAARPSFITSTATPFGTPSAAPAVVGAPVVAPGASPVAPSASVAVVRFGEDQGVAFKAPPRPPMAAAPAASPEKVAPAPRPRVSAVGPALHDGSLSLGASPGTTTRTSAAAPPASPAPPKRGLTPEQQLAEAQLKASMR